MSKTRHEFEIDYSPIVQGFDMIKQGVNANDQEIKGLSKDTKTAFDAMTNSARNYNKELTGTSKDIANIQSETKKEVEIIRQLTLARKASNDPAKIAAYNKQIEESRNRIKSLNSDEKKRSNDNDKATKESSGLINGLIDKQKKLTEARDKSNDPNLIKRYNKLIDESKQKLTDLTSVQKKADEIKGPGFLSGALNTFGGNVLFAGVQKIKDAFGDIITGQVNFNRQLKNLSAITGASAKDLIFYGDKAIEMGKNIEGGAVAAVEAYKLIGSAKPELLENKEALIEVTDAAVTLSQAAGLTLPEAATKLGDALNAFQAPAKDATKFINVLSAASKLGAKEIPFITEALTKFGGVAKSAGVSIETSASAIELLGAAIPEASTVGTNLRGVLIALQTEAAKTGRPFKGLKEELDLLAPKVKDITFLSKTFGEQNLLAIQTLIIERNQLKDLTEGVTDTNDAFEQAAQNTDTLAQSILVAGNNYDSFILSLKGSKGIIKSVSDLVGKFFENLTEITSGTAGANNLIRKIESVSGVSKKVIKDLINLGLEEDKTIYQTIASNEAYKQRVVELAAFSQGLDMAIDKIKSSNKEEEAAIKIRSLLDNQAQKLKKANNDGSLSLEDYKIKLGLLSKVIKGDVVPSFKSAVVEAEAVSGIIEKLQKEITALTDARTKATSVSEISRLNIEIKAKQDELDKLLNKENSKLKQANEEFQRAIDDLRKKAGQAKTDATTGEERIALEQKFNEQELQITKDHFIKLGLATGKNFKLSIEQEAQFQILLNAIRKKAADESIKLEVDRQAAIDAQRKQSNENTLQGISEEESRAINSVNNVRKPDNLKDFEDRDFEESKQKQILDIQEFYAKKRRDLRFKTLDEETEAEKLALQKQLQIIGNADTLETNAKRTKINNDLALLDARYDLENQKIINETNSIIADINNKRDGLNKPKKFNLAEFFGLSGDDVANIQRGASALIEALDTLYQAAIQNEDKQISTSKEKISTYENEIQALHSKLDEEKQIQDRGKANNIERVQSEIDEKERAKRVEEENAKKALARKKELQKQQLLIDSITQASNLITASTEILANTAKDPISLAIALGAVGAMIVGFGLSKAAALKAINEGNDYYDGGYTGDGGKYEEKGTVHAGEFVMSKEKTKDNRLLFEGIHEDDSMKTKIGLINLLENTGVSLSDKLPEMIAMKKETIKQQEINAYLQTDNSRMEKDLNDMKIIMSTILDELKIKTYNTSNGDLVHKKGSHINIIKR